MNSFVLLCQMIDELFEMEEGKMKHVYLLYRYEDIWNMMKAVFLNKLIEIVGPDFHIVLP